MRAPRTWGTRRRDVRILPATEHCCQQAEIRRNATGVDERGRPPPSHLEPATLYVSVVLTWICVVRCGGGTFGCVAPLHTATTVGGVHWTSEPARGVDAARNGAFHGSRSARMLELTMHQDIVYRLRTAWKLWNNDAASIHHDLLRSDEYRKLLDLVTFSRTRTTCRRYRSFDRAVGYIRRISSLVYLVDRFISILPRHLPRLFPPLLPPLLPRCIARMIFVESYVCTIWSFSFSTIWRYYSCRWRSILQSFLVQVGRYELASEGIGSRRFDEIMDAGRVRNSTKGAVRDGRTRVRSSLHAHLRTARNFIYTMIEVLVVFVATPGWHYLYLITFGFIACGTL